MPSTAFRSINVFKSYERFKYISHTNTHTHTHARTHAARTPARPYARTHECTNALTHKETQKEGHVFDLHMYVFWSHTSLGEHIKPSLSHLVIASMTSVVRSPRPEVGQRGTKTESSFFSKKILGGHGSANSGHGFGKHFYRYAALLPVGRGRKVTRRRFAKREKSPARRLRSFSKAPMDISGGVIMSPNKNSICHPSAVRSEQ
ncbi:hypothetical protein EVAR_55983_1 [Eumeta japonica]|uniref:Uncharacterized protein n=1 Tax=Eumeta variegata TaxID=151549 RepID=A0A4C1YA48_EUMVA|nr:hypothetical protein EVAR_55983_1 [Eumeta japonica]